MQRETVLRPTIATDVIAVGGVALLTAAAAQVSIHIGPVPQTLQTFSVLGGSAWLGSRRGLASMALYVALGLVFPVYAGGGHGWTEMSGTSGGYLAGFVLAGLATGWACERFGTRYLVTVPALLLGSAAIYVPGLLWFHHLYPALGWSYVIHWGFAVFVVGDLLKIAAAVAMLDPSTPWGGWLARRRLV
ncbi:MAG TPA: biotin transporter BioY [Gaiellales bacterium]|nr:biotin transporter BioY [Gaiellales bacterium]